jgi:glycosyltransferase involved in cell wall biosynthesis/GR25 family glycosyltransferase involved in LPS biosynthesis
VLGTGAILYDARTLKLSWRDFQYRNMADIWLTEQAQKQGVPLVCVTRPRNWIIQNKTRAAVPTIYDASHGKTGTAFDTGTVQTAVVVDNWPVTLQPWLEKGQRRPKVVMSITTWNRCDYLKDCIESFERTRSTDYDWVLIIADDGSTDGTLEYLENLLVPHEMHVIRNKSRYACGQTNTIFELCQKIGFDFAFKIDDDILFKKRGWDKLYIDAARAGGYPHLCHRNWQQFTMLKRKNNPNYAPPPPHIDGSGHCETIVGVWECDGCLFTFTSEMIDKVGFCDENNFPIRGQWHIDYSIRCCRAGFNDPKYFYDARDSNQYIELQANKPTYRCSLPWGEEYKKTKDPAELARRTAVMKDESRVYVPLPASKAAPVVVARRRSTVNEFFDKVYVLNLDRRPDRLATVQVQMDELGITFERFVAVDGQAKPYIDEWLAYSQTPRVETPEGVRKLTRSQDFYQNYDSPIARTAYFEGKLNKKAIRSAGAWGYLKSYIGILEKALREGHQSILILDDDALFHRDFKALFSTAVRELPEDWKIFQLGALQYDWGDDWISKFSEHLYLCNGSSVGSHATGIHRSIIPALLHQAARYDLPLDVGALCYVKRAFAEKSFTVLPNLIIQDTSESDIASSDVQQAEGQKRANVYRWVLEDYPSPSTLLANQSAAPALKSGGARA